MIKRVLLVVAFSLAVYLYQACSVSGSREVFEDSEWISTRMDNSIPNQWVCFRKSFSCGKVDESAVLHIGVDSKYWLWINGQMVIFEGGLKRGPNPDDTYYDSIPVGKYLRKGENTLAVLVWYFGKEGFDHKNSGKCGLIAEIGNGSQVIVSDTSWKARIHPAFGDTEEPHPNFRLPESNVRYDASLALGEWMSPGYDDSFWESALALGRYPCAPWNILWKRPIPNWKDSGIIGYERIENEIDGDVIRFKGILPKNISVTPYMMIRSKAGLLIDIRSDNYEGGGEPNVRAEYITREGDQEFEMPNYVNGHSIIYTCPKDVEIIKLGYRETAYDTEHIGSFSCSDDFYNILWRKSLTTMSMNMRDAIQDPDRERSQWWGDATIVIGEILYSCDSRALPLIKKAIDNLVDWQRPDSVLYSPVPAGNWNRELPLQSLASIGKFGFWDYYFFSGDAATMLHAYPAIRKYLSLWQLDENDLVIHRPGEWDWPDWGQNSDVPILDNAWYCLALEAAAEIAKIAHDNEYASYCETLRSRVLEAARMRFWDGQCYRSPGHDGPPDDRANGMAILAGFALPNQMEGISKALEGSRYASPYMEKYILESYFIRDDIEGGLARMKERYNEMVSSGLSTLWELWDSENPNSSINHGWAGGSLTLLSQYVAGISPVGPGWERILVRPQLGNLEWVDCAVPVGDKTVSVHAGKTPGGMRIEIQNPTGKPCLVVIPENVTEISCDGKRFPVRSLSTVRNSLNGTNDGQRAVETTDRKVIVEYVYE
ncbi:MAG: alpha-L-rhamnosidase N-terminal domain-containing protein [Bacteroidales bacterium]|nr:alpha-L-rhamnosidase N-terminal domain-containing protein [Bacteroidales bacterium]